MYAIHLTKGNLRRSESKDIAELREQLRAVFGSRLIQCKAQMNAERAADFQISFGSDPMQTMT